VTGCVRENVAQSAAKPIFAKINALKVGQKLGYFCNFQKAAQCVNNRPMGSNSPNLVTMGPQVAVAAQVMKFQPKFGPVCFLLHSEKNTNSLDSTFVFTIFFSKHFYR
jgi:hypothetical protein